MSEFRDHPYLDIVAGAAYVALYFGTLGLIVWLISLAVR